MKEENEISPEQISDNTEVTRFVSLKNPFTQTTWTLHCEMKFKYFEKLINELIEVGFVNITAIDVDKFAELSIKNYNTCFYLDSVSKLEGFMKSLSKRINEL